MGVSAYPPQPAFRHRVAEPIGPRQANFGDQEVSAIAKKTSAQNARDLDSGRAHSDRLLELVKTSLDDDKAIETVVIDLAGKTSFADYMVIASGRSSRQVAAMAVHLQEKLKSEGYKNLAVEGLQQGDWVLLDAGDVIVHVFRPEVREFYNLEKMWDIPTSQEQEDSSAAQA